MDGLLGNLARFRAGRSKRISSYDRSGGNADYITLAPGETVDVAAMRGAGVIRHLWFTLGGKDPMLLRNVILRIYWDGEIPPCNRRSAISSGRDGVRPIRMPRCRSAPGRSIP